MLKSDVFILKSSTETSVARSSWLGSWDLSETLPVMVASLLLFRGLPVFVTQFEDLLLSQINQRGERKKKLWQIFIIVSIKIRRISQSCQLSSWQLSIYLSKFWKPEQGPFQQQLFACRRSERAPLDPGRHPVDRLVISCLHPTIAGTGSEQPTSG